MVERLCMCGAGSMWEFSVLSAQFCCEYKTALKKKKGTRAFICCMSFLLPP